MRRPSPRASWRTTFVLAAAFYAFGASVPAKADWNDAGAATAAVNFDREGRVGGVLIVDFYKPVSAFRVGFGVGAGTFTRGEDADNRVFAPLAFSAAVYGGAGRVRGHAGFRLGVWGGADFDGLTGGLFGSVSAGLDIHLGGGLTLGLGADVWLFTARPSGAAFGPSLVLSWAPEANGPGEEGAP
ncbi:MAG: hypothetical protein AAF411_26170 [Myxococcota bacterium]